MAHMRELMAMGVASPLARMLGNNRLDTVIAGGSGQADATPLTINFALIDTATAGQGVRLGLASGAAITALYNVGPAALNLYPAEEEVLNDQTANLPLSLPAGQTALGVPSIDAWLVQIPPGGPPGGITDAPSDGNAYGRYNASWAPVLEIAGGTLSGPLVLAGPPTVALGAATKGYVDGIAALLAPLASPVFTGTPSGPTPAANDNSTRLATTAYVKNQNYLATLTLAGDLAGSGASPLNATVVGLQGHAIVATAPTNGQVLVYSAAGNAWTPTTAPPASAGGATGQLQWNSGGALAGVTISGDATINTTTGNLALSAVNANVGTFQGLTLDAKGRVTGAANMNYAPLASPTFTGTPAAPTPAAADNSTALATTAFVKAQGYLTGNGISGLTAGQLAIAGAATTLTASIPYGVTGNNTIVETTAAGVLAAGVMPAYTGDVGSPAGSTVNTLATVNGNVGTFQGITLDAKGRATAAVNQNYATTAALATYAPLASPSLTGTVGLADWVVTNGQIQGNNATSSWILWPTAGVSAPTFTTRSVGTRLVLFPAVGASSVDIGLGIQGGALWQSVRSAADSFYWYGATTACATLSGTGTFNVLGGYNLNGTPIADSSWYFNSHNLIGTQNVSGSPAPIAAGLQFTGQDSNNPGLQLRSFGAVPVIISSRADGTMASPTAIVLNDTLQNISSRGWNGSGYSINQTSILAMAAENWSATANGTQLVFQVTTLATTTLTSQLTIAGAGLIVGNPTGGLKGAGTLNATAVYANGTLLTSDARMKRDIVPLAIDALGLVMAIEPKSFKHIAPPLPAPMIGQDGEEILAAMPEPAWWERTWWGFIADEVEGAIAGAGHEWGGMAAGPDGVQALSYNDLIAVLWRAVQELQGQIAALRGN